MALCLSLSLSVFECHLGDQLGISGRAEVGEAGVLTQRVVCACVCVRVCARKCHLGNQIGIGRRAEVGEAGVLGAVVE